MKRCSLKMSPSNSLPQVTRIAATILDSASMWLVTLLSSLMAGMNSGPQPQCTMLLWFRTTSAQVKKITSPVNNSGIWIMGWKCSRIRVALAVVNPAFNNNSNSIVDSRTFIRRRLRILITSIDTLPIFHPTTLIISTGRQEATKCAKCSSLERTP